MTDTMATLTTELAQWTKTNHWKPASADELRLTVLEARDAAVNRADELQAQADYLSNFCERWDVAVRNERDDDKLFNEWRSKRQWFHDLRDFCNDDNAVGPGYGYPCGWVRLNTDAKQNLGRYMTMCPFDVWGDLHTVERALWEGHARIESSLETKS